LGRAEGRRRGEGWYRSRNGIPTDSPVWLAAGGGLRYRGAGARAQLLGMSSRETDPPSPHGRRLPPPLARVDLWAAILLVAALAASVARYGVDLPHLDGWVTAFDLAAQDAGALARRAFTPHNEHRLLLPRLLLAGLARLTGWNVRVELALVVVAAAVLLLLVWWLGRLLPAGAARATYRLVASVFVLGLHQVENLVWGWQLSLFLATLAAVAALGLLGDPRGASAARAAGAALLGAVASFSYGAGLVVWPAGVAQLLAGVAARRRRRASADDQPPAWPALAIWAASTVAVAALYLGSGPLARATAGARPAELLGHALAFLGSPLVQWWRSPGVAVAAGAAGLAAATLWAWRELARGASGAPWLGLGLFSVGAAGMTALGRSGLGLDQALSSRYTTLANLFWVSLVGALLAGARPSQRRATLALAGGLGVLVLAGSAASVDGFVGQHAMRAPARAFLARGVLVTELAPLVAGDLGLLESAGREICAQRTSVFRGLRGEELDCRFEVWPVAVEGTRALPPRRFRWDPDGDPATSGRLRSSEGFPTPVRAGAVEGQWSLVRDEPGRACLRGWARDAATHRPVVELIVAEGGAARRLPFRRQERRTLGRASGDQRFLGIAACWEPAADAAPTAPLVVLVTNDRGGTGILEPRRQAEAASDGDRGKRETRQEQARSSGDRGVERGPAARSQARGHRPASIWRAASASGWSGESSRKRWRCCLASAILPAPASTRPSR
jgi:hypothetical protein